MPVPRTAKTGWPPRSRLFLSRAPVVDLLLASGRQLPYLFEDCIGQAAARLAADALGDRVAAVYRNLILDLSDIPVAELDTLILSRDGGLRSSRLKRIAPAPTIKRSNQTSSSDPPGAFSAYCLIYPLTVARVGGGSAGTARNAGPVAGVGDGGP